MKISIIIPVYNVADFIEKCIDSVTAQNYGNIECIVVDDCGIDNSMELVEQKILDYSGPIQFIVISHSHNRGLSAARNTGTKVATGEYVYYLDSDDSITPDCIELLAGSAIENLPDFVVGNYLANGEIHKYLPLRLPSGLISTNEKILSAYVKGDWYMMAWNKLVRRNFIVKQQLYFMEGAIHEDNLWSFMLACTAETMAVVNKRTYNYLIRDGSITSKKSMKHLESWIDIAVGMVDFVRRRPIDSPRATHFAYNMLELLPILFLSHLHQGVKLDKPYLFYRDRIRPSVPVSMSRFIEKSIRGKFLYAQYFMPTTLAYLYNYLVWSSSKIANSVFSPKK